MTEDKSAMDDHNPIAQYWDLIQRDYDYESEVQRLLHLFESQPIQRILDIGCGTGTHLLALAERGYSGMGIDRSQEMLQQARAKAREKKLPVLFSEANLFNLPMLETFDAVISHYVMSSMLNEDSFEASLRSVHQVLKPGGVFIFNALNADADDAVPPGNAETPSPPMTFMDLNIHQDTVSITRFNRVIQRNPVQDWTYLYLFQDGDCFSFEILNSPMRTFSLSWIEERLVASGFILRSVTYVDVGPFKKWDMLVEAQAIN
jgi:SAM-dependent methyltransferase